MAYIGNTTFRTTAVTLSSGRCSQLRSWVRTTSSHKTHPCTTLKSYAKHTQPKTSAPTTQATAATVSVETEATPTAPSQSMPAREPNTVLWNVLITSTTPLLGDSGTNLVLRVVDKDTDQGSGSFSVDAAGDWEPPVENVGADGVKGWYRKGLIRVPSDVKTPSAILVTKNPTTPTEPSVDYISQIDLITPSLGCISFPCHSWVSSQHGERVFFEGTAYLPKDTPPQLADDRATELAILRGKGSKDQCFMRTYDYQVYDDLGLTATPGSRPSLGFTTTSQALPYPRRIATGTARGKDFIPFDEQFNYSKQRGFQGDTLAGLAMALSRGIAALQPPWFALFPGPVRQAVGLLVALLSRLPSLSRKPEFNRFEDVKALYKEDDKLNWTADAASEGDAETSRLRQGPLRASAVGKSYQEQQQDVAKRQEKAAAELPQPGLGAQLSRFAGALLRDNKGEGLDDLLKYPVPKVEANREGMWAQDKEFGRQVVAGMNPVALYALKEMPAGSNIKAEHVDDDLKRLANTSLSKLLAVAAAGTKPRLFMIDYWVLNAFWSELQGKETPGREEHVGRCLLFLGQDETGRDEGLLPLAIELLPRTQSSNNQLGGTVYSRYQLQQAGGQAVLWQLAKAVFKSIDSGYHQLVSHWLRCHACMEPFLIAMRRTMSIMHPVTKLMLPHFRYTLNINTNARSSLINEGGTIESAFTPGPYAMRLTSAAYSMWRFRLQALPADLKARGMTDSEGHCWLTDYPYADDGMDLWRAVEEYFDAYLALYYSSDDEVAEDAELQAWWAEVKTKAHPDIQQIVEQQFIKQGMDANQATTAAEQDIWGFSGPISSKKQLVQILTTIAWTTSAHHAAVNFGQYDYSALMLNASSLVRRPIPDPAATNHPAYKALVNSGGDAQEKEFLTYLGDFQSTLRVMTTVKLLSGHADDEQYLDEPNHMFTDPAAIALNQQFINRMKALEVTFLNRNVDPVRWTRGQGTKEALEYTLLYPSSGPGVTMRGVPYSVSI